MTIADGLVPRDYYYKAGDIIYSTQDTNARFKILEVINAFPGAHGTLVKTLLKVQNMDTGEVFDVLGEWMTKDKLDSQWRDDTSYTALRAIDELKQEKPKELMSSEFIEGKKISDIIASWNKLGMAERDSIRYLLADRLHKKTGERTDRIEKWLDGCQYRVGPDGTYWVFDDERRIACKISKIGEIENDVYFIANEKVRPLDFFQTVRYSKIKVAAYGDKYLLTFAGKLHLINGDDLELWASNYNLPISQIKSSIARFGHWSI